MPTNPAEYRLTPKAKEDLEEVWLYTLTEWGAPQSNRYIDDLTDAFTFLVKSPESGIACDNIRQGCRRYPVMRHVVYYRETAFGIKIIRVLHERMLPSRHIRTRKKNL